MATILLIEDETVLRETLAYNLACAGCETLTASERLDEYEVRGWQGWHHHMALSLLVGAVLLTLQQEWEKRCPTHCGSKWAGVMRTRAVSRS